ncbi:hypothetical protein [Maribacter stanieri]|uniref:hypothetical protein n=1 Tax=Maribacter stanieri TaxID=440514 RepID=UPI0030D97BC3|tara:strand:- start:2079 stop:2378 length:300 start_codon:yes stop_codon:yes gene_type:complete
MFCFQFEDTIIIKIKESDLGVELDTFSAIFVNGIKPKKNFCQNLVYITNLEQVFLEKIANLQRSITTHRTQNFTGGLLQHQTMTATKFMGKWIEEKNRG